MDEDVLIADIRIIPLLENRILAKKKYFIFRYENFYC